MNSMDDRFEAEQRIRKWARIELYTELATSLQIEANSLESGDPLGDTLFSLAAQFTERALAEAASANARQSVVPCAT